MELHQVRYFLAVASTLNFTRAAEQCNVTQPALTKGVQKLEQELGGQLIYRERQLTQLTDLGKEVLPMLERTLASAEAVRRRAHEFQRKEVAPLKIGLAPSISASLVLDPIAEIAKFVPGLHVELREGAAEKLVELLLGGEINAAMVGEVHDLPARIDEWLLFEERYVAFSRRHTSSQTVHRSASTTSARPSCWSAPDATSRSRYNGCVFPRNRSSSATAAVMTYTCSTWRRLASVLYSRPSTCRAYRRSRPSHSKATRFRGRCGCWLCRGATTRRRWTLSSRWRGFATGRSKSLSTECRRQCSRRWRRACMTATLRPVANYSQAVDPHPDALPMQTRPTRHSTEFLSRRLASVLHR